MVTKYQVFVSSTYDDLKEERDRVIQGILEMGHIPVGMEMFSAANDQQWKIIAKHIDESDYYVVIVAHRYGSMVDGLSYTQKEYEYAVSRGVPVIGFIIESGQAWPADKMESGAESIRKLNDFKRLVKSRPVGFWTSADDLYGKSTVALVKEFSSNPRVGWVRATAALGPEVTAEMSRLSAENSTLRDQLEELTEKSQRERELEMAKLMSTLENNKQRYSIRISGQREWQNSSNHNMRALFKIMSPLMIVESTTDRLSKLIAINSVPSLEGAEEKRTGALIPMNELGAILSKFMALDLMAPSTRRHPVADKNEYWSLTDTGIELAKHMSRLALESPSPEENLEAP